MWGGRDLEPTMRIQQAHLSETAGALRTGDRPLDAHVDRVCDRVDAVDPDVRALVDEARRRERLRADADDLHEAHGPDDRPPLYGVPVGIKDIVHVDGFTTRAGSALPPELFQGPEATVVSDLKAAGALVLGKTVTTEFAGRAPGLTRNPHDLDHTPGGSSSGSAAAVAAGMCPLAVGTQTGGSVIRPAAFCGVVGFKPSFGRIPTDGVLTRSESLDHVGLFTQDVAGMGLAASVVCEGWETDANPAERPTLGVPEGPYLDRASDAGLDAFESQIDRLADAGYDVERVPAFDNFAETDRLRGHVASGEVALVHGDWFDEYEPFYRTAFAERIRSGQDVTTKQLTDGRTVLRERREGLQATMDDEDIDLWVCPAAPGPAPAGLTSTGDSVMNRPWTDAGLPAVTVPAGTVEGLPVGLQCVARFGADERLLAWAESVATAL
jgi:Asp-tRNA(Asn)/Glu-tRNA(Gln) amidotransferase A subunit family amidase